jgi:hypothetical protein
MGRRDEADGHACSSSSDWLSLARDVGNAGTVRELARILETLALASADLGAYARAAETARIAVEVHRGLAEREGTSLDPGLARAQVGLGVFLFLAGRDGSLDAALAGGRMYRELARGVPGVFTAAEGVAADVASVLDNSIRWWVERAGKREEGLEAPGPELETAILLLSEVRQLHADDASASSRNDPAGR